MDVLKNPVMCDGVIIVFPLLTASGRFLGSRENSFSIKDEKILNVKEVSPRGEYVGGN